MNLFSVVAMSAAVITGLAGAGVAYELAAGGGSPANTSVTDTSNAQAGKAAARPRFAPCEPPAVLEKGTCVTDVVRTVVQTGAHLGRGSSVALPNGTQVLGTGFLPTVRYDDDGPLHDLFDDHGGARDDFDHHSGDDDFDDFDDDHSGHGGDDSDDSDD
jgi:hypothetical protein